MNSNPEEETVTCPNCNAQVGESQLSTCDTCGTRGCVRCVKVRSGSASTCDWCGNIANYDEFSALR